MIDEQTLIELSGRFRDLRQLERDYLLTLLLNIMSSEFTADLVFKGGTALKYFYGLNRFSEDLDFSYDGASDISIRKMINDKIDRALKRFGMQYKIVEHESRANREKGSVIGISHTVRVAGPLNRSSNQLQNMKIDVSLRRDMVDKPVLKYMSPIYPDIATFSVVTMDIEEILAEKIAAIIEMDKMRDIYDAYYLLEIKKINYNDGIVATKLAKRHESFDKNKLKAKIDTTLNKMKWRSELSYLVDSLPENTEVVSRLNAVLGLQAPSPRRRMIQRKE